MAHFGLVISACDIFGLTLGKMTLLFKIQVARVFVGIRGDPRGSLDKIAVPLHVKIFYVQEFERN